MRITVEQQLHPDTIKALYEVYAQVFGPLRTRAAARQLLTEDEFIAEMCDERIDKYVVWRDDGRPAALTTLATDLNAVPWISQDFYTTRFPDHAARKAIFYLGYTLVHPDLDGEDITAQITAQLVQRIHQSSAVCAFDVPGHDDDARAVDDDHQTRPMATDGLRDRGTAEVLRRRLAWS